MIKKWKKGGLREEKMEVEESKTRSSKRKRNLKKRDKDVSEEGKGIIFYLLDK